MTAPTRFPELLVPTAPRGVVALGIGIGIGAAAAAGVFLATQAFPGKPAQSPNLPATRAPETPGELSKAGLRAIESLTADSHAFVFQGTDRSAAADALAELGYTDITWRAVTAQGSEKIEFHLVDATPPSGSLRPR